MQKKYSLRTLLLALVLLVALSGLASAAVSVEAGRKNFDLSTMSYVLEDNVVVDFGSRVIRADKAKVKLASMEVWAEGSITLTQEGLTFSGDSLYASNADKTAFVQGSTVFDTNGLHITADNASYNWQTKIASFTGNVVLDQEGTVSSLTSLKYHVIDNRFIEKDGAEVNEPGPAGTKIEDKK